MLQPGAEVVVNATFAPTVEGSYSSTLEVDSNGGDVVVAITGNSTPPPALSISATIAQLRVRAYRKYPPPAESVSQVEQHRWLQMSAAAKIETPVTGPFPATTALP